MIDLIAAIEVASDAAARQDAGTTLADIKTICDLVTTLKAKGLDVAAMDRAGTLRPAVQAVARTSALVVALQTDAVAGPHVAALIKSFA